MGGHWWEDTNANFYFLKASAFHYPPYTTVEKAPDGMTNVYGGMEYHIFASIANRLGFDYTVAPPVICCTWGGKPIADGTGRVVNYTGVVGDLHNNFVDIAWTNLYYKGGRLDIIDLTMANIFCESGFLVRRKMTVFRLTLSLNGIFLRFKSPHHCLYGPPHFSLSR